MPALRSPRVVHLTAEARAALVRLTRRSTVAAGLAQRARIVLLAADGLPVRQIAPTVGVDRNVVRTWLDRFRAEGLAGLTDRPRPGRPRAFPPGSRVARRAAGV
jgi:predicted ArsR family transcriptional regulator